MVGCGDGRTETLSASSSSGPSSGTGTTHKRQKRRLDEIGMELQRVSAEQEACKKQISGAYETTDVISMQHKLNRLTQRQVELSDEEASLKGTTARLNGQGPMQAR